MNDVYKQEQRAVDGAVFNVEWVYDYDSSPLENSDLATFVREISSTANKRPGEIVLHNPGRRTQILFDFQACMQYARKDNWGAGPRDGKTLGQYAEAAVLSSVEWLKDWYTGRWHYCGISVVRVNAKGKETDDSNYLWGIEAGTHNLDAQHEQYILEIIGDIP